MKSEHQKRIEKFMTGVGQNLPSKPEMPNQATRLLRSKLILEECIETIRDGLGFDISLNKIKDNDDNIRMDNIEFLPNKKENLIDIADGCGDISVVTYGTLSSCGISDTALIEEIDNNNLLKIKTGHRGPTGKWQKSPNHPKPKIKELLEEQSNSGF